MPRDALSLRCNYGLNAKSTRRIDSMERVKMLFRAMFALSIARYPESKFYFHINPANFVELKDQFTDIILYKLFLPCDATNHYLLSSSRVKLFLEILNHPIDLLRNYLILTI